MGAHARLFCPAAARARESERPDAVFHDPLAKVLAGKAYTPQAEVGLSGLGVSGGRRCCCCHIASPLPPLHSMPVWPRGPGESGTTTQHQCRSNKQEHGKPHDWGTPLCLMAAAASILSTCCPLQDPAAAAKGAAAGGPRPIGRLVARTLFFDAAVEAALGVAGAARGCAAITDAAEATSGNVCRQVCRAAG